VGLILIVVYKVALLGLLWIGIWWVAVFCGRYMTYLTITVNGGNRFRLSALNCGDEAIPLGPNAEKMRQAKLAIEHAMKG